MVPKGETPSSLRSAWRAAAMARRLSSTASAPLEQVLQLLGEVADRAHLRQHVQGIDMSNRPSAASKTSIAWIESRPTWFRRSVPSSSARPLAYG